MGRAGWCREGGLAGWEGMDYLLGGGGVGDLIGWEGMDYV